MPSAVIYVTTKWAEMKILKKKSEMESPSFEGFSRSVA